MTYAIGNVLDVLPTLDADRFQCCVTSPPYWGLRDYGHADQLGLEPTPEEYVANMVRVFREVRRVLRPDGVLWLNLGDSYAHSTVVHPPQNGAAGRETHRQIAAAMADGKASTRDPGWAAASGMKPKDLVGIPWSVAFALRADGWYLRSEIIWEKRNPMPESVTDRPTKAHEQVFLLSKSARYFYDAEAIREEAVCTPRPETSRNDGGKLGENLRESGIGQGHKGGTLGWNRPEDGRNARSVWTIASQPFAGAHFATMPPRLAERCILAGSRIGDEVLDPFLGSGTVGMVAESLGRRWFGVELNAAYEPLIKQRTAQQGLFGRTGS